MKNIHDSIKQFDSLFKQLAGYKRDSSTVLTDFLDCTIKGFSPWDNWDSWNKELQTRYDQEERYVFGELVKEFILTLNREIQEDGQWFDVLGTFYEHLVLGGDRKGLAQFFTPSTVVEFMTQITGAEHQGKTGQLINDPCSGSGRFIIAFHAHNPGNYYVAEDLDVVCCKMTAVNMCVHGAVGIVIHHNSLMPDHFLDAWSINEILGREGIPTIRKITQEEANMFYRMHRPKSISKVQRIEQPIKEEKDFKPPEPVKLEKVEQLTLFS